MQRYIEDVAVGEPMTQLVVEPTAAQLFFFSAATYNGHRIHYDRSWAVEVEGHPDVLVQGPLQAALMARAVTAWAGPAARLVGFQVQNRASAFPGERLRFTGTVEQVDRGESGGRVVLALRGEKGADDLLMPGRATVELPSRAG